MLINSSVLKFMPDRLRRTVNVRVRVRLNGRELVIPASMDDGLQNVFWTGSWKTEVVGRLVDAGDGSFIDVGANVGQTLLDLYLTHPETRYVGFEPRVACISYLRELIRVNSIENYQIIPVGLAEESECRQLFSFKYWPTDPHASIISDLRPNRQFDIDIVPCFKFDDVRQSLNLGRIGFVKVDVEGAELETLAGMSMSLRECRPLILCEVLFTDSKADLSAAKSRNDELMRLLTDMRYEVVQLIKSADTTRVVDAQRIQEFASAYYTVENAELCDYLFVPEEKATHVLDSLLAER